MDNFKKILTVWFISVLLLLTGASQAALLGVHIGYPQISYTTSSSQGNGASYDAGTGVLTIVSTPIFLTKNSASSSTFITAGDMSITANIDNAGMMPAAGGGTFEVKSGATVLLAGTVNSYGKSDTTSLIDFTLTVTSGTLQADFLATNSSGEAAAVMGMLSSTFNPDRWAADWTALDAKGDIGPRVVIGASTIGYWKNHPEVWSGVVLNICGNDMDQNELIGVLTTQVRGDKTISMAHQLIAAMLNQNEGSSCPAIDQAIIEAEAWLCQDGRQIGDGIKQWGDDGKELKDTLDDFNNIGCI